MHRADFMPPLQSGASINEAAKQPSGGITEPDQPSTSRLLENRQKVIFNQFMPVFLELGQVSHPRFGLQLSISLTKYFQLNFVPFLSTYQKMAFQSPAHGYSATIHPVRSSQDPLSSCQIGFTAATIGNPDKLAGS